MSKKKHRLFNSSADTSAVVHHHGTDHAAEYKVIKGDLLKVLAVNVLFLAAVLTLYFTNLQSHYLESFFDKFIKF